MMLKIMVFLALILSLVLYQVPKLWQLIKESKKNHLKITAHLFIFVFTTILTLCYAAYNPKTIFEEFSLRNENITFAEKSENIILHPKEKISKPLQLKNKDTIVYWQDKVDYEIRPDNSVFLKFIFGEDKKTNKELAEQGLMFTYETKVFILKPLLDFIKTIELDFKPLIDFCLTNKRLLQQIIIIILILGIAWILFQWRHKAESFLLSYQVSKKMESDDRSGFRFQTILKHLQSSLAECYFPSINGAFIVGATILILAAIAWSVESSFHKAGQWQYASQWLINFRSLFPNYSSSDLIAIHAGIGTLIFALIIFVAEHLRNDQLEARVLLRESYLYPLTLSEISVFCLFIFLKSGWVNAILVIAVGIMAIISMARIIRVLLNHFLFSQSRLKVFKERLKKSIELAVRERIGNNIILARMNEGAIKFQFRLISLDRKSKFFNVNSNRLGVVSDINFKKIEKISELLDEIGQRNGFTYEEEESISKTKTTPSFQSEVRQGTTRQLKVNRNRYLIAKYKDILDEEHKTLLSFDEQLLAGDGDCKECLREINKLAQEAFVITNDDNFSQEVRTEMGEIKDRFIEAIRENQLGKVQELISFYRGMSEAFLEYMQEAGIKYSSIQARQERGQILGGWDEIRWLRDDVREIFDIGISSQNREIVRNIAYLPISIVARAVKYGEQYVFQEFIAFSILMYLFALKLTDQSDKDYLIERASRYLHELCSYQIEPKIQKQESEQEVASLKDSIIYVIKIYQDMMKLAFDSKDEKSFGLFLEDVMVNLCKNLHHEYDSRFFEEKSVVENINSEIQENKRVMLFGLGAWLLSKSLADTSQSHSFMFYEQVEKYYNFNWSELVKLFLKVRQERIDEFWGWFWWDAPRNGVFTSNLDGKFNILFCVLALKKINRFDDAVFLEIDFASFRVLADMAKTDGGLSKILDDIDQNPDKWSKVLSTSDRSKIPALKDFLKKADQKYKEDEKEKVRNKPIDASKIEEFKKDVLEGYQKSASFRKIFEQFKLSKDQTQVIPSDKKRLGLSIAENKEAFFQDWHVGYHEWGVHYGQDMGQGEDFELLKQITESCELKQKQDFLNVVTEAKSKSLFIIANHRGVFSFLRNFEQYESIRYAGTSQPLIPNHEGWFEVEGEKIPVFTTNLRKKMGDILLLDKNRLGHLVYYSPSNSIEDDRLKVGQFYVSVRSFSEDPALIEEFIKKSIDWLKKEGNEEAQRKHLRERVLVEIYERFEFERHTNFLGYKFDLRLNRQEEEDE